MRGRTDSKTYCRSYRANAKLRNCFFALLPCRAHFRAKRVPLPLVTCLVGDIVLLLLYLHALMFAGKQGQVNSSCAAVNAAQHSTLGSGTGV